MRRDVWPWLVALLFAVLAALALVWALSERGGPKTAKVPAVEGTQQAVAVARLRNAGLSFRSDLETNNAPPGRVLVQTPGAGAALEKGARVHLSVSRGPAVVAVPTLTGIQRAGAIRVLRSLKLTPEPTLRASSQPAGTVISQSPLAGDKVAKGSAVLFAVSEGPRLISVPSLRGVVQDKAAKQLQDANLDVQVRPVPSAEPPGTVIAQSPARGAKVKAGTTVTLNVSKGTGLVAVPSVRGMTERKARSVLRAAGFDPFTVLFPSELPAGTVIAQDPPRGAEVKKGTRVRINVSKGPPASGTSTAATTTTTP